jgi:hypothetical protein
VQKGGAGAFAGRMEDALLLLLLLLLNEKLCEMQIGQGKLDKAILRVNSLSWEI